MLKPIPKIRTKEIRRELAEVPIIPPAPPSRYIVSTTQKSKRNEELSSNEKSNLTLKLIIISSPYPSLSLFYHAFLYIRFV
jgi:hypothetical protein